MADLSLVKDPAERALALQDIIAGETDSIRGGREAERALESLAAREGDDALVEVLNKVSPEVHASMISAVGGLVSIVAMTLTPEQIAEAVAKQFVLAQERVSVDSLRQFQDEAVTFMSTVLLLGYGETHGDETKRTTVLRAIAKNPTATYYLAFLFMGAWEDMEITQSGDFGPRVKRSRILQDVNLRELRGLIQRLLPRLWREVYDLAYGVEGRAQASQEPIVKWFNEMREALMTDDGNLGAEDMFLPLD